MMKRSLTKLSFAVGLMVGVTPAAAAEFPSVPVRRCAPDAVLLGTVCHDRYEASVWRVPNPSTTANGAGALTRGGSLISGTKAGALNVLGRAPFVSFSFIGFRCAR